MNTRRSFFKKALLTILTAPLIVREACKPILKSPMACNAYTLLVDGHYDRTGWDAVGYWDLVPYSEIKAQSEVKKHSLFKIMA